MSCTLVDTLECQSFEGRLILRDLPSAPLMCQQRLNGYFPTTVYACAQHTQRKFDPMIFLCVSLNVIYTKQRTYLYNIYTNIYTYPKEKICKSYAHTPCTKHPVVQTDTNTSPHTNNRLPTSLSRSASARSITPRPHVALHAPRSATRSLFLFSLP